MIPQIPDVPGWLTGPIPYAVTGGIVLAVALAWVVALVRRPRTAKAPLEPKPAKTKASIENRLTFLVALIIAGVCAQGMGMFFYDKENGLGFPLPLVIVVGGVLELTAFTCALRARRNVRDPNIGKAGIDGIAVWVVTALSGVFSALEADDGAVQLFRLIMPLLAAWLWERGMSIERRRAGHSTIHWRVTPERVLVWLRIAEPTGRTASEVDAHRRLTKVAKAAKRVRRLTKSKAWFKGWRLGLAEARLERAMEAAVAHTNLAGDPVRQQALLAQIGSLYNAAALADLTPAAPWAQFAPPVHQTWFEAQGLPVIPAQLLPPVQRQLPPPTVDAPGDNSTPVSGANTTPPVGDKSDRQNTPASGDSNPPEERDKTAQNPAPTRRQQPTRSGGKSRKRRARRSMAAWVELAGPIFHSEFERLQRQPTGEEFAEAIKKAGHGTVSASTAKNIRTEILDRAPLPTLD